MVLKSLKKVLNLKSPELQEPWGMCPYRNLKSLAYIRASSTESFYPIPEKTPQIPYIPTLE